MRVAVITSENAAALSPDDPILLHALEEAGHQVEHWCWDRANADWQGIDLALVRSTWDYFRRMGEFRPWLRQVQTQTTLANEARVIEWNLDKRYLLELTERAVPVVPTRLADRETLASVVTELRQEAAELIVKPVISGGAWGLQHLKVGDELTVDLEQGPWLVQPVVESIRERGELSLIYLGNELSHAIRKWPKEGDLRVQKEHGGHYEVVEASSSARALARQTMKASLEASGASSLLYARIDMVERDGGYELMEAELIEPELFFSLVPEAAPRLAALV